MNVGALVGRLSGRSKSALRGSQSGIVGLSKTGAGAIRQPQITAMPEPPLRNDMAR